MYAPHTVTLFTLSEDPDTGKSRYSATVLRGVFLEESAGAEVQKSGLRSTGEARLFIPFAVKAEDAATGEEKIYVGPGEYARLADKAGFWTLKTEGTSSACDCWFVKGEVTEVMRYGTMRETYEGVYRIRAVTARDYGSEALRHWDVSGA